MARNQRLDATISIGSVMKRSVKRNFNVIRAGLDGVGDQIKQVTDRQRELSRQRRVLERQGESVDHLDREYQQLTSTLENLRRKQERLERAQRSFNRVGREFGRMTSDVGRFARRATLAIGGASTAVFGLANSTASLGDEVAKQADNLGFGIEEYQELRYAAERSGVSISTFDSSMVAFTKRLGEAAQGTGQAGDALDQLGLSAEELIQLEPDTALEVIAQRMQDIESPAERAAIASDLFSRQGVRMTNMLGDGAIALRQLRDDAQSTGYVLSEEAARDAEQFRDSLLDARLSASGLKNTLGVELMPVVQGVMDDFGAFMRENRDEVQAFSTEFADGLRDTLPALGRLFLGMATITYQIGRGVAAVADFIGGWDRLGMVIGAVMASRAVLSIGSFVFSVFSLGRAMFALLPALPAVAAGIRAIGAAMIANPIGVTIMAIAAGAYLIMQNWERVEPVLRPILDTLGEIFDSAWNGAIKPMIDGMVAAKDGILSAWQGIRDSIGGILDWMGDKFESIMSKIQPVIDGLTWIRDKGEGAVNAVGEFGSGAVDTVTGFGSSAIDNVTALGRSVGDFFTGNDTQERAVGGTFRGGSPLLVGERGPELMFPSQSGYIANNTALRRMASMANSAASAAAQVTQNITINAQGMSVEALVDELERRKREAQDAALFDGAAGYGQYGGAYG